MFARMLDMAEGGQNESARTWGKQFARLFPETSEGQCYALENLKFSGERTTQSILKTNVSFYFSQAWQ